MKTTNNIKEQKMKKRYEYKPSGSQLNPETLNTETVQFWTNGIMLTADIKLRHAKEMVKAGSAFVITSQAIGSMKNGIATS